MFPDAKVSASANPTNELSALEEARFTMLELELEPAGFGVGVCEVLHPLLVANIAATNFSSCGLLFPRNPARGCELRVIEQLLMG